MQVRGAAHCRPGGGPKPTVGRHCSHTCTTARLALVTACRRLTALVPAVDTVPQRDCDTCDGSGTISFDKDGAVIRPAGDHLK